MQWDGAGRTLGKSSTSFNPKWCPTMSIAGFLQLYKSSSMVSPTTRRAVFLDRDGTLIEDRGYPAHPRQVQLLPGVPEALEGLRRAGFLCVAVTNQSGVGRGLLT